MGRWSSGLGALVIAALVALAAAHGARAHGSHKRPVRGALIYKKLCADCHGSLSHDGGAATPPATGAKKPDLLRLAGRDGRFDRHAVALRIDGPARPAAHGTALVPVWGDPGLRVGPEYTIGEASYPARLRALLDFLEHVQPASAAAGGARSEP